MRTSGAAARIGSLTLGTCLLAACLVGATAVAAAETVPLPVPSPKKRVAQATPPARAPLSAPAFTGTPTTGSIVPVAAPAQGRGLDGSQKVLADKVSGYLSGVHALTGNFIQVGPDGGRTEGQFYIQKPGKVRFEYNPPSPIDVVADGNSVVVRDRKLATQDLYPLSQTPLRYLLVDKIDLTKDTNVVSVSADDVFVTIVIEEKQALTGTHKLMMMFGAKDMQLKQWTVTDPQGYDTTVAVYNLDPTAKPDPGLFRINYERVLQ
ncbi:outer membrane lipoprotein carrier protein LolA [Rhodoplanes elegans]